MNRFSSMYWLFLLPIFSLSCVNEDFDIPEPEPETDPDIQTNASISDITALWQAGQFVEITEDLVFDAIVVADDLSGNYFRSIVIQDETGGIELLLNARDLHVDYPQGRRLFIKAKGLLINDFAGKIQLGASEFTNNSGQQQLGGIEEPLFGQYIVKGIRNQTVEAVDRTIADLGQADLSTLVRINNIEFVDTSVTFADAVNQQSENLDLQSCDGESIILRSSGFADFASEKVPNGNGSIVGIYSTFNGAKQLFIRNLDDVTMMSERCGGGGADCENISGTRLPLQQIRVDYTNGIQTLGDNVFIEGTVISDISNGSTQALNIVLMDEDGYGITLRCNDDHNVALNEKIRVDVSNMELGEFMGLLQVQNLSPSRICSDGAGSISPLQVSVSDISSNLERYESTLVQIDSATLGGGPNYEDNNVTVSDGTGDIQLFTRRDATFSGSPVPTGTVRVTAIVGQFNEPQLSIRSTSDIVGGGGGSSLPIFQTDFSNGTIPSDWRLVATKGNRLWEWRSFMNYNYVQMSSFNSGDILDVETWMILPEIDFDAQSGETIRLEIADAFENGNPLRLVYSTNYDGLSDPTTASWTEIGATSIEPLINNTDTYDNVYESTGPIDLSMINGKAHLGFIYDSANGTVSTIIQISKIEIRAD